MFNAQRPTPIPNALDIRSWTLGIGNWIWIFEVGSFIRTLNSRSLPSQVQRPIPNVQSECRTPNSQLPMSNALDIRSWTLDIGNWIWKLDVGSLIRTLNSRSVYPHNVQHPIPNVQSECRTPNSQRPMSNALDIRSWTFDIPTLPISVGVGVLTPENSGQRHKGHAKTKK